MSGPTSPGLVFRRAPRSGACGEPAHPPALLASRLGDTTSSWLALAHALHQGGRSIAISYQSSRRSLEQLAHELHAEVDTAGVHGVGHIGLLQNPQAISQVVSAIVAGLVPDRAIA